MEYFLRTLLQMRIKLQIFDHIKRSKLVIQSDHTEVFLKGGGGGILERLRGWPLVWIFNEFLCGFSFAPEKLKDRAGMRHHLEVYRNIKAINYIAIVLAWITRYGVVCQRMDGIGKWICINYMLACHTVQVMLIDCIVMITSYLKKCF